MTFNEVKSLTWAQLTGLLNALTNLNVENKAAIKDAEFANNDSVQTSHAKMLELQKDVQERLLKEKQEVKNGINQIS